MKKTLLQQGSLLLTSVLLLTGLSLTAGASSEKVNEYLVKYNSSRGYNFLVQRNDQFQLLDSHDKGQFFKIGVKESQRVNVITDLINQPGIEYVVPNAKMHSFFRQTEYVSTEAGRAALKDQWAIANVNAQKAWDRAGNKGSKQVLIAVIDTGVDYTHESLAPNMVPGYDFNGGDSDPQDETGSQNPGHGTHCAGAAGATGLKDGGIIGLSPEVSIMPLRFLGANGSGDLNNAIKSIDYAIEKNAQVISASWGAAISESNARPMIEALKRADDKGIIFVAAAANDGKNNDTVSMYPTNANLPNSISVAASNDKDAKPSWSNFGTARVHVAAPGEKIMSTLPKNKYGNLSGTSMATPLVAGLAAFLKAQDSSLTGAQVRALIQTTGAKVSIQTACNCRVDAFAAVDTLLSKKMYLVPAAASLKVGEEMTLQAMNANGAVTFASSSENITVDAQGVVKAASQGKAVITVKDSQGNTASTLDFHVGTVSSKPPTQPPGGGQPPGQPPGGGGECPIGDQATCDMICGIMPDLPFCQQQAAL